MDYNVTIDIFWNSYLLKGMELKYAEQLLDDGKLLESVSDTKFLIGSVLIYRPSSCVASGWLSGGGSKSSLCRLMGESASFCIWLNCQVCTFILLLLSFVLGQLPRIYYTYVEHGSKWSGKPKPESSGSPSSCFCCQTFLLKWNKEDTC